MDVSDLLAALQEAYKRAERMEAKSVVPSYVADQTLVAALMARDNGIIFGRRGAGKTHALRYLAEKRDMSGDVVVYIDLSRDLGSTGSLYSDDDLPVSERATRLLVDVVSIIHQVLREVAFNGGTGPNLSILDQIFDHISEVVVAQAAEAESTISDEDMASDVSTIGYKFGKSPELSPSFTRRRDRKSASTGRAKTSGPLRTRVHLGALATLFQQAIIDMPARRFWLLLDEWNAIPVPLQPYLAEMLRHTFFSLPKTTVRIAAIEHRSEWRTASPKGGYVGVEVGAEIFSILDLDEFGLFLDDDSNDRERRISDFYGSLLLNHINLAMPPHDQLASVEQLEALLFAQPGSLTELARAADGVPRDGIAIAALAAQASRGRKISVADIRYAAKRNYKISKLSPLSGNPSIQEILEGIVEIVGVRGTGGLFLMPDVDTPIGFIADLIDARLLHVIRRASYRDEESHRKYDLLKLDYSVVTPAPREIEAPEPGARTPFPRVRLNRSALKVEEEVAGTPERRDVPREVDTVVNWMTSSYHGARGGGVQVAFTNDTVLVRDAKNPQSAPIAFTSDEWEAFVTGIQAGEF